MHKLLLICDAFATEYDIKFNAQKFKLLVVSSHNCRRQANSQTTHCSFSIGGNPIERVETFSHLGHIITSRLSDNEDLRFRRNCFIGQVNHRLRYCYNGDVSFLWENGNFDPIKIETLEQIDTQFVRIDYVHEMNVCSEFGKNPFTGDFWAKG